MLLSGDYLNSQGTGSRGVNMFNASLAGRRFTIVRRSVRASTWWVSAPVQDTDHWGDGAECDFPHRFPERAVHRRLSRPALQRTAIPTGGRNIDFDGDERVAVRARRSRRSRPIRSRTSSSQERYYGNYSALIWDTTSESRTHELRLTSPDSARTADLGVGLLQIQGRAGRVPGHSARLLHQSARTSSSIKARRSANPNPHMLDVTFALTDRLRITGGARYSDESKERVGLQLHRRPEHERRRHSHEHARFSDDRLEPHAQQSRCER